jgi:hypothetical protein
MGDISKGVVKTTLALEIKTIKNNTLYQDGVDQFSGTASGQWSLYKVEFCHCNFSTE